MANPTPPTTQSANFFDESAVITCLRGTCTSPLERKTPDVLFAFCQGRCNQMTSERTLLPVAIGLVKMYPVYSCEAQHFLVSEHRPLEVSTLYTRLLSLEPYLVQYASSIFVPRQLQAVAIAGNNSYLPFHGRAYPTYFLVADSQSSEAPSF